LQVDFWPIVLALKMRKSRRNFEKRFFVLKSASKA
jgi:hypothetical protein